MRLIKSADMEGLQFAAMSFKKSQQFGLAEESYRKLIALEENLFGPETSTIALALYNLAEVVVHQQRYDEARSLLRRAVEIWEKAHPNDYMSLMSYTEAVNMVNRRSGSGIAEVASSVDAAANASPEIHNLSANVLPMHNRKGLHNNVA